MLHARSMFTIYHHLHLHLFCIMSGCMIMLASMYLIDHMANDWMIKVY